MNCSCWSLPFCGHLSFPFCGQVLGNKQRLDWVSNVPLQAETRQPAESRRLCKRKNAAD